MLSTVIANLIVILQAALASDEYKSLQAALKMARSKGVELQVKLNAKKPVVVAECRRIIAADNEQEQSEPVLEPIAANVIATVAAVVEQVVEETKTYEQGILDGIKLSETKVAALEAEIAALKAQLAGQPVVVEVQPEVVEEEPVVEEEFELVAGVVDDTAVGISFTDEEVANAEKVIEIAQAVNMEHGLDGLVPFYFIRECLGHLTREQQDRAIYCTQWEFNTEIHTLQEACQYTEEQLASGIPMNVGGDLFFVEV
jgi:hypothetical protein